VLVVLVGCNSSEAKHPKREGTVRYRLLLRANPVSPQDAAHCYAACQPQPTPKGYVECLAQCPGFEITPGEYCSDSEVPPVAACLTVRKIPVSNEPPPGLAATRSRSAPSRCAACRARNAVWPYRRIEARGSRSALPFGAERQFR
jgi:hypothetical protein